MKAVKFVKEFQALCDSYCKGGECKGCPIGIDPTENRCGLLAMQPKPVVKLVKKWAKERKKKGEESDGRVD